MLQSLRTRAQSRAPPWCERRSVHRVSGVDLLFLLCLFPRARRAAVDALQRLLAEGLAPRAGGGDGVCAPAHDAGAAAETASSLFPRSESLGSTCSWETLCFAEESSA